VSRRKPVSNGWDKDKAEYSATLTGDRIARLQALEAEDQIRTLIFEIATAQGADELGNYSPAISETVNYKKSDGDPDA